MRSVAHKKRKEVLNKVKLYCKMTSSICQYRSLLYIYEDYKQCVECEVNGRCLNLIQSVK